MTHLVSKFSVGCLMMGALVLLSCGGTEGTGRIVSLDDLEGASGGDVQPVVLSLDHDYSILELELGETLTLNSVVAGLDDLELEWDLLSDDLASLNFVQSVGFVTGKSLGQALLRVKFSDYEFDDDASNSNSVQVLFVSINVVADYSDVVGIEMSESGTVMMSHMDGGNSSQLTVSAQVSPFSLLQSALEWDSSNLNVIDFSSQFGKHVVFQTQGVGEADVRVTSLFDPLFSDSVHVVVGSIESISLDKDVLDLSYDEEGISGSLSVSFSPSAFDSTRVNWSIDDDRIATIDALSDVSSVIVTGLSSGNTVVRVSSKLDGSFVDSAVVSVSPPPVSGIVVSPLTFTLSVSPSEGSVATVSAYVYPSGFYDEDVEWISLDPSIVTLNVLEGGEVELIGISQGSTVVRATSTIDDSFSAEVSVIVEFEPILEVSVPPSIRKYQLVPLEIDYNGDLSGGIKWTHISGPSVSVNAQNELFLVDYHGVLGGIETVEMEGEVDDEFGTTVSFSIVFNPVLLSGLDLDYVDKYGDLLPVTHSAYESLFAPHIFEFSFDPGESQLVFTGLIYGESIAEHVLLAVLDDGSSELSMRVPKDDIPGIAVYESSTVHDGDLWIAGSDGLSSYANKLLHYDPDTGVWTSESVEWSPRSVFCFFSYRGDLFVSGGLGDSEVFQDLWRYSSGIWGEVSTSLEMPIFAQADYEDLGGCVVHEDTVYMYGSWEHDFRLLWSNDSELEVWDEFDLTFEFESNWISFEGRLWAAMFDQSAGGEVVVTLFTSFDGVDWTLVPEIISFSDVFDNNVHRIKLFSFGDRLGVALETLDGAFEGLKFLE